MAKPPRPKLPRNTESNARDFEYFYDLLKRYPPFSKEVERHYLMIIHGYTSFNPVLRELGIRDLIKPTKHRCCEFRKDFIAHNMRLVISRVKRRRAYNDPLTMTLISAGQIGLITAIDKFDVKRKTRFSTYATHWIEHYIKKEFEFAVKSIHPAPTDMGKQFSEKQNLMRLVLGETPSDSDVFDMLGWGYSKIQEFRGGGDMVSTVELNKLCFSRIHLLFHLNALFLCRGQCFS